MMTLINELRSFWTLRKWCLIKGIFLAAAIIRQTCVCFHIFPILEFLWRIFVFQFEMLVIDIVVGQQVLQGRQKNAISRSPQKAFSSDLIWARERTNERKSHFAFDGPCDNAKKLGRRRKLNPDCGCWVLSKIDLSALIMKIRLQSVDQVARVMDQSQFFTCRNCSSRWLACVVLKKKSCEKLLGNFSSPKS